MYRIPRNTGTTYGKAGRHKHVGQHLRGRKHSHGSARGFHSPHDHRRQRGRVPVAELPQMTPSQMAQEVRAFIEKTTRYADAWGVAKAVKARFSYIVASWVEFGSNGVQNVWCRFKDDIKSVFDLSEIIANAGQLKFA